MGMTACQQATEQLLAYVIDPSQDRAKIGPALDHLKSCPYCQRKVNHLISALTTNEADQLTCQECEELLPDYIEAKIEDQTDASPWSLVAQHLAVCPDCSAAYAELTDLMALVDSGPDVALPAYSTPDLSFLDLESAERSQLASDPNWLRVTLDYGQAWLERETGRWRQLWLSLPPLKHRSLDTLALTGLMNAEPRTTIPGQRILNIAPPEAGFALRLTVTPEPASTSQELYRLEVDLTLTDRLGDFSGAEVTLLWGSSEQSQKTNEWGEVVFSGLPDDQLASMDLKVILPD